MHKTIRISPLSASEKSNNSPVKSLENALSFDPGFPHTFCGGGSNFIRVQGTAANFARWPRAQPIRQ
ncbi:hypothetical protein L226DRAFT_575969 [Lentinus tigrinus ALCF2SS1-7]|uniref:Uncharacterized protein n=1 Tax=Lentinus tigrinus ALCF2SS1-6 TaxID=1328759 RepID=A0A5C2S4G6_9APHY|nr:hypothetical protein L227DRAFT_655126 [Lentinus tigrinus ALCF2SS1-6]RPD69047.1 hypothetical protein L226DRAFT_575969 [Lentinus tigrinus ALCF2SS1-7]